MRFRFAVALGASVSLVLACAEDERPELAGPDPSVRFAVSSGLPCDAVDNRIIKAQQSDLFPVAQLKIAQNLWAAVVNTCSPTNADAANAALMAYVNYVRGLYPASVLTPRTGDKELKFLAHINTVFPYVGYTAPNVPAGASGPLQAGIFGVILAQGGQRELTKVTFGAIELIEQNASGDQRGHLFVMYPTGAACLTVDNLDDLGNCVEVRAFPAVSPRFSPKIKIGVCFPDNLGGVSPALGHEFNSTTEIAGSLAYPANCHATASTGSWTGGFGEVLKRFAWIGSQAIGVNKAYASHAGLGGIGGGLSPFDAVDVQVFAASFNSTLGAPPIATGNFTFTDSVSSPGFILVQSSLGQYGGPLVVMSQGGGNCASCGGLLLQANLYSASGTAADDGVYDVSWISVQASPSVKGAPFVLRDDQDRELARLTYVTTPTGKNLLYYNDAILVETVAGNVHTPIPWVRNVAQTFKIRVNLNSNTTTLFIGGAAIAVATDRPFVNPTVTSFDRIAADFKGIDSGVMGWDEIGVQRIADH